MQKPASAPARKIALHVRTAADASIAVLVVLVVYAHQAAMNHHKCIHHLLQAVVVREVQAITAVATNGVPEVQYM